LNPVIYLFVVVTIVRWLFTPWPKQ